MATPKEIYEQLKSLVTNLSTKQQIIAGGVIAAAIIGFGLLFYFVNKVNYRPLYTDLSQEDAAEMVSWLKKEGIPYNLGQGGSAILVPEAKVYDIRIGLAGAGLPKGKGVGMEVFDQNQMGATDFLQNVQYQRAIQGELERTISRFPQIKGVRVHLAQPKDSLFVSERKDPTASVVLQMQKDQELTQEQVKGIVHLVSAAIPRLKKENVSVVDTTGNVLFEHKEQVIDPTSLTNSQLAYQRRLEDYYKHKIQSMLEDALGPNKAVARVSAEIDFSQEQITEDKFDPDTVAVRSEQKLSETEILKNDGGIPGVKGGLADKLQGNTNQAGADTVRQKSQNTTNFEITRLQRQVNASLGRLKRISAGVMVDGTYQKEGKEDAYKPRSPEEIAGLEKIVRAAIGYSAERGDDVRVINVPFESKQAQASAMDKVASVGKDVATPVVNLILALLFIFLVIRPLLKKFVFKEEPAPELAGGLALEGAGVAGEGVAALPSEEAHEKIAPIAFLPDKKEELREIAMPHPERAAALIKIWLRERNETEGG